MAKIGKDKRFSTEYPLVPYSDRKKKLAEHADESWAMDYLWGIVGEIRKGEQRIPFGGFFKDHPDQIVFGHLISAGGAYQFEGQGNPQEKLDLQLARLWRTDPNQVLPSYLTLKANGAELSIQEIAGKVKVFCAVENAFWLQMLSFSPEKGQPISPCYYKIDNWEPIPRIPTKDGTKILGVVGWTSLPHQYDYLTGHQTGSMAIGGLMAVSQGKVSGLLTDLFGISTIASIPSSTARNGFKITKRYIATHRVFRDFSWLDIILNVHSQDEKVWSGQWNIPNLREGDFKYYLF